MRTNFDVVIAGSGLVGASLAIALHGCGLHVAVVEAVFAQANHQASYDERNLALSRASVQALNVLGVWKHGNSVRPIRRIHVSRRGNFGSARLNAADHGVEEFGAVIPARELGNALLARLADGVEITRICPAKVARIEPGDAALGVRISDNAGERLLQTRLLVGADGTESQVRRALGIDVDTFDYGQTGFVTTVTSQRPLHDCAFERFTDAGPVALLPLGDSRAGLVLTVPAGEAAAMEDLSDQDFMAVAQERFGYRLGRLTRPGRRVGYPLRRVRACTVVGQRAVLVGNAAQTIHPIGAQGFNLGLRDALTLAEALIRAARRGSDPGDPGLLADYARAREPDRANILAFSEGLVKLYSNNFLPLRILCALGLMGLDRSVALQHPLVMQGMGYGSAPTSYALGIAP